MGCSSSCGLDSISSVDDMITDVLFRNPTFMTTKQIHDLGSYPNNKMIFVTSKNGNNISMIEIMPTKNVTNKLIIYSHGNGENLYTAYKMLAGLSNSLKIPVISYDYIGYGISSGRPSEEGCYESIHTIVDYVLNIYPNKEILLIGLSLGTGVVIEYITKTNWKHPVLLLSAYKSIPRVVTDSCFVDLLLKHNHFDSIKKIDKAVCPILFMHGKNDELISYHHTEDLYNMLPNKKFTPLYFDDIGHDDILTKLTHDIFNSLYKEFG